MKSNEFKPALVAELLESVARHALKCGVGVHQLEQMLRTEAVRVASTLEICGKGKRTSASAISALTGLSRKEVTARLKGDAEEKHGYLQRVLAEWSRVFDLDPINYDFDFVSLVYNATGDVPPRAVLRVLLWLGWVRWHGKLLEVVHEPEDPPGARVLLNEIDAGDEA